MRAIFTLAAITYLLDAPTSSAIDICSGGNRAARLVTCLVDGDTGWEKGAKWRLLNIDTPETSQAECPRERELGDRATQRLQQLMAQGYRFDGVGEKDNTAEGRDLVRIILADGSDAGQVLLREGLAQPWPNQGNVWCQ